MKEEKKRRDENAHRKDAERKEEKFEDAKVEKNDVANAKEEFAVEGENSTEELETLKNLLQQRDEELEKEKKEYLFLMAEFDNFKKRTLREKSEIIKNGAEGALKGLLPVIDDFERGLAAIKESSDASAVKEGLELIYNKFVKYLEQNGVKEIVSTDSVFDADLHDAIAMVPVDDESKKGKVIDTIAKGYTLNDKVIRHSKVAVGQ